jgi:flagellin
MGFRIQNNIAALNSFNHLNKNSAAMDKSLARLSSGYRINSAADDAAGLSSSMRLRAEVSSLRVASRNAAEATSLLQVAEGAMSQIDLILNRMKELATQAASGNSGSDLSKIDSEVTALENEINRITGFTEYNNSVLLEGGFGSVSLSSGGDFDGAAGVESIDVANAAAGTTFTVSALSATAHTITLSDGTTSQQLTYSAVLTENQDQILDFSDLGVKLTVNSQFAAAVTAGDITTASEIETAVTLGNAVFQLGSKNSADHRLGFTLADISTASLNGGSALSVDLSSTSSAQTALTDIDAAISHLASKRAEVGTLINRLSYASSNLAVSIENKTASESTIRDVDMASEMSEFTKNQILVQASTAMLAQANASPQAVLSLLR